MTISSIPQLFQFNTSQTNKNTREILPFQKKKQHFRLNNSKKKTTLHGGQAPGYPDISSLMTIHNSQITPPIPSTSSCVADLLPGR